MLRNLENKVAWVTGAGTGIGEAGAIALAEAGMHVVLSSLDSLDTIDTKRKENNTD